MRNKMSHLDENGNLRMVDVGEKATSQRVAIAEGLLLMKEETRKLLFGGGVKKGDALAAARIAGILGAKKTCELIPLCHPLQPNYIGIDIEESLKPSGALVRCTIHVSGKTGAEMEALTGASTALLTLYDMLKAVQKDMRIDKIRLRKKTGGKSGDLNLP